MVGSGSQSQEAKVEGLGGRFGGRGPSHTTFQLSAGSQAGVRAGHTHREGAGAGRGRGRVGQEVVRLGSGGPPRKENHFQQVHLSMLPATHPTPALSHPPLGSGKYIPPDWPRVPALCTLPVQAGPWIELC